jgi:hypothetical protein
LTLAHELEAMRLKSVHQKLFSFCNGKPTFGIIAKVNDLVKGFSACAQLWDQSENGKLIVILSLAIFWYSQSGFPAANQSMSVVADGKLIYSHAQNDLKHGKKGLSIETTVPSGWNDNDFDEHILDGR